MNSFAFSNWSTTGGLGACGSATVFTHETLDEPPSGPEPPAPEPAKPATRREHYLAELNRVSGRLTPMQRTPLSEVLKDCLAQKRAGNRRELYVVELDRSLRKFFKGVEDLPASLVTTRDVEQFLAGQVHWNPSTKRCIITRLSAFFTFALKRGYVAVNPVEKFERILVDQKPPVIFTPEQAEQYVQAVREVGKILLPGTIIGLYAGVRTIEVQKLTWSDIDLDRAILRVDAANAKCRQRRLIPLHPKAVALLRGL